MKPKPAETFHILKALPTRQLGPVTRKWQPIIVALKPGECIEYRGPRPSNTWLTIGKVIHIPLTTQRQKDGSLRIWKRKDCPNIRRSAQSAPPAKASAASAGIRNPQSAIQP